MQGRLITYTLTIYVEVSNQLGANVCILHSMYFILIYSNGQTFKKTPIWTDEWMNEWMDGWMDKLNKII